MPVTVGVTILCLLLASAGEPLAAALSWQRDAILQGEAWRLWTGHLVHFSPSHAGADALALFAVGGFVEQAVGARRYAMMLWAGGVLLSLALLPCAPALAEYRGASGLAMLAAGLAGVHAWRRHPACRPFVVAFGLALAAKTLWDMSGHAITAAGLPDGVAVAWQAHALGALLGCCAGLAGMARVASRPARPAGLTRSSARSRPGAAR